jgi:beta-galactosidase
MAIIKELGANTLRLAHYQHSQYFYDLCDENGIIVWAEIPYITMHMSGGRENTLSQMEELIVQNYNHPSIAVWGLSNEITAASTVNDELLDNHRALNELCHRLDPTRKTTMANVFMLEIESPILEIPDVNSYNLYFGWYLSELSQNDEFFDEYHEKYPDRAIGFSEYGADANPRYQSSNPEKGDYTESYQCVYHEHMLNLIEARPWLWATHVWNLFDFGADGRDEGGKNGQNQKGLVTFDRKLKKDAFYLYKAAWNKSEPFVHLCGSRYVDRAESITEVKVYSNLEEVSLYVDDRLFETKSGKTVFKFSVPISQSHTVKAVAGGCSDTIRINKVDSANPEYSLPNRAAVVNWFDTEIDPGCFSVNDKLADLQADPRAGVIIGKMMAEGAQSRGDVATAVKDNPALIRMMGRMTLLSLLKQGGADEESIKQLNRVLQTIKKPEA